MWKDLWRLLGPDMNGSEFVAQALVKLILSSILGAAIGLERQFNKSPAGLRTNMFICMGSAFYTMLSFRYSVNLEDHNRITAQIITGIGFIGAGAILHSRGGSVTGLTTAATIFMVAAVGMAVGGGEYPVAIFATLLVLLGLSVLGRLETRFNLKTFSTHYEVIGKSADKLMAAVNMVMEEDRLMMDHIQMAPGNDHHRMLFYVDATRSEHRALAEKMRKNPEIQKVSLLNMSGGEV